MEIPGIDDHGIIGSSEWRVKRDLPTSVKAATLGRQAVALEKSLQVQSCGRRPRNLRLLNEELNSVVSQLELPQADVEGRERLISDIEGLLQSILPGVRLVPFGSFAMGLTLPGGDLDLSLDPPSSQFGGGEGLKLKEVKVSILRNIYPMLRRQQAAGRMRGLLGIFRPQVPLVKFTDVCSRVPCDVSVSNFDGVFRSRIVGLALALDPRFPCLCRLVKSWARFHKINDSSDGTLNSISLVLLVAFHLQTREPPILPPFKEFLGTLPENGEISCMGPRELHLLHQQCQVRIAELAVSYLGAANPASLAELLVSFFDQMAAVKNLWEEGLCASTYHGTWIHRNWNTHTYSCAMGVEDFTDVTMNCARSVRPASRVRIYECVLQARNLLSGQENNRNACANLFGILPHIKEHPPATYPGTSKRTYGHLSGPQGRQQVYKHPFTGPAEVKGNPQPARPPIILQPTVSITKQSCGYWRPVIRSQHPLQRLEIEKEGYASPALESQFQSRRSKRRASHSQSSHPHNIPK